jgi:ATPase subunit of ABC transporter with duplicated ATPase domains
MEGRVRHAHDAAREGWAPAERQLRFWLPGSVYRGDAVLRLEEGRLDLGAATLRYPALRLGGTGRAALCGPNGSGKSSLVHRIVASLALPAGRVAYVPQEIPAGDSREIASGVRRLPEAELGHLMTVVAGLGSDPRGLLATEMPSPGETRKLLLALGVVREPWFIVMDEPTNHLDLPSIELLERALADCPCALLLVSHDERFLDGVGCGRWRIRPAGPGAFELEV